MSVPHYYTPPWPISSRVQCPVCRQQVYSRGDIHPQCAVRQADQSEQVELKKARADGAVGATDHQGR
jgi:hypothetical protein